MSRFKVFLAIAAVLVSAAALDAQAAAEVTTYEAQSSAGLVTLEARPEWRDGSMLVSLSANTHSVDLSTLDLTESVRLLVGGLEYAPGAAGSLSGHHAKATLTFDIAVRPDTFKLRIRNVPDVPQRILEWPQTH